MLVRIATDLSATTQTRFQFSVNLSDFNGLKDACADLGGWLDDAIDFITGLVEDTANWAKGYINKNIPDIGIDLEVTFEGGCTDNKGLFAKACLDFELEFLGTDIPVANKCISASWHQVCINVPWPISKQVFFSL